MPLFCWCYLLGALFLLLGAAALALPGVTGRGLAALPRNFAAGCFLTVVAWVWTGYALWDMDLDLINPYKQALWFLVPACIVLSCWWLENLLACRAIAAILMLYPFELLHVARVNAAPERLVLIGFAYACIVIGMAVMLYPWKLREALAAVTKSALRVRIFGGTCVLWAAVLFLLGAGPLKN